MTNTAQYNLTPAQMSALTGVSASTIRRWEADGVLQSIRDDKGSRFYNATDAEKLKAYKLEVSHKKSLQSRSNVASGPMPKVINVATPEHLTQPLPYQEITLASSLPISEAKIVKSNNDPIVGAGFSRPQSDQSDPCGRQDGAPTIGSPSSRLVANEMSVPTVSDDSVMTGAKVTSSLRFASVLALVATTLLLATAVKYSPDPVSGKIKTGLGNALNSAKLALSTSKVTETKDLQLAQVLAATTTKNALSMTFAVPTIFKASIDATGQTITAGSVTAGKVTAPNLLYSVVAGPGIDVSAGQNPTITNTGLLSFMGTTGDVTLTASDGLKISGLTMTNTDKGSSQNVFKQFRVAGTTLTAGNNSDYFEMIGSGDTTVSLNGHVATVFTPIKWTQGTGVLYMTSLTDMLGIGTATPTSKLDVVGTGHFTGDVTLDSNLAVINTVPYVWPTTQGLSNALLQNDGTGGLTWIGGGTNGTIGYWSRANGNVFPSTITDKLGIGTTNPQYTLDVNGTMRVAGASITGGIDNNNGGITNAGAITGATGLTSSGTITFSGLGAGVVRSSLSGVLSTGAVNLGSEVSGTLPVTNGGTGLAAITEGAMLYASAANVLTTLGAGTQNQVLVVDANGKPSWGQLTNPGGICPDCVIKDPNSTQTILPGLATAIGISLQQPLNGSVDVFNVLDHAGTLKYLAVTSTGDVQFGSGSAAKDIIAISPAPAGAAQHTGTISSLDLTADRSYTLPNRSGSICVDTGNCAGLSGQIGGSGIVGYVPVYTDTYMLTSSSIFDNGNVGIGTTTPGSKLSVTNLAVGTTYRNLAAPTSGAIFEGNVGIGVTNPSTALEVGGTFKATGASAFTDTLGVTGATTLSSTLGVTGDITTGGNLKVNGLGNSWVSGKLGIGTTLPTSALSVGATNQFQVNSTGNIVRINDIATSFPASQGAANSLLTNDSAGNLTWANPTSTGILGYWNRTGTSLAPTTAGDAVTTSGNISATGTGTITSAGLLTASNGLTLTTGALNLTATSGALSLTGLSTSAINTGANTLNFTSGGASGWTNGSGDLTLATTTSGNVILNPFGTVELQKNTNITGDLGVNGATSADITSTTGTATLFNSTVTSLSLGGAATTLNIGPTGSGAGNIVLAGGSSDTGCTLDQATGNLVCSGNVSGAATGTQGYWNRTATTLSPINAGDAVTSSGLLTASNGLTLTAGAINLTATSGALSMTGLGASTISTASNNLTLATVTSGTLALTSAGALNLSAGAASTWTLPAVANALNVDSNTLTIDASSHRVGIGLTNPAYKTDILTSTASDRGLNILNSAATGTNYGLYSSVTGAATANIGGYFSATGATTSRGLEVAAMTSATSTGLTVGALSGTTADTGISIGAISGTGATGTGMTVGNISTTGTTNAGLVLGTMTGGTTSNYQISTGVLTSATTTTNAQLNLGGVVTTGGTTNYGINVGALSGTGTNNYGLNIATLTSTGTVSTALNLGGLTGAATTNKGVAIGAISGTSTNAYGVSMSTITGGTTGNYQIQTGAITATGTTANAQLDLGGITGTANGSGNYGMRIGAIGTVGTTTTNAAISLGTMTGGTTSNYQIQTGVLTSATTTTNAQLNLGGVVTTGGTTNYGINVGALSGTGTTNYGVNVGASTATGTTNYGINVGNITGAASGNNYGVYIGTVSGANTNNAANNFALYSAGTANSYFAGNVGIGATNPTSSLSVGSTSQFQVNSTGNIVKINNVATSFPASQGAANSILTNDSAGNLTWANPASTGTIGYLTRTGTTLNPTTAGDNFGTTGSIGIGTTAPAVPLDIQSAATTTNIALITPSALTTGNALSIVTSGNTLTSGHLLNISSALTNTTFTGSLANIDWSPSGSTQIVNTGDLLHINVGQYGTIGNLLNILDNGSSIFSVSQSAITAALPFSDTAAGDVSIAYDLQFTNGTISNIKSNASLAIAAGETFNSSNLTLQTYNSGQIVLDSPGGVIFNQGQTWTVNTAVNALNFQNASLTSLLSLDATNGRVGIGTTSPLTKLTVLDTISTSPRGILSMQISDDTNGARVGFAKARGTVAAPTTVATADTLGRLMFRGYDGTNYLEMASIEVGASGTVAAARVPTFMAFSTGTDAATSVLTERMRIDNAGNVGIGVTAPTGRLAVSDLAGSGNRAVYSDANGNLTNSSSDQRLKTNIVTISDTTNVLDDLSKLRGVFYNWNTSVDAAKYLGSQREMGMIAQEVGAVLPELVGTNANGYQSLDYPKLTGFLVEVAKAQQTELSDLKALMASPSAMLAAAATPVDLGKIDVDVNMYKKLNVLGKTTLGDVGITGTITAGLLTIDGLDATGGVTINSLSGTLSFLNGDITMNGKGLTASAVTAGAFNVKGAANAGHAVMTAGTKTLIVPSLGVGATSLIMLTPEATTSATLSVIEKHAGSSFKVVTNSPVPSDLPFSWLVIGTE